MNYRNLVFFDYICAQYTQCRARITNMEIQHYNRLKAVNHGDGSADPL